jgi:hypothetical protein
MVTLLTGYFYCPRKKLVLILLLQNNQNAGRSFRLLAIPETEQKLGLPREKKYLCRKVKF